MPPLVGLAAIYRVSKKDIIDVLDKFQNFCLFGFRHEKNKM